MRRASARIRTRTASTRASARAISARTTCGGTVRVAHSLPIAIPGQVAARCRRSSDVLARQPGEQRIAQDSRGASPGAPDLVGEHATDEAADPPAEQRQPDPQAGVEADGPVRPQATAGSGRARQPRPAPASRHRRRSNRANERVAHRRRGVSTRHTRVPAAASSTRPWHSFVPVNVVRASCTPGSDGTHEVRLARLCGQPWGRR